VATLGNTTLDVPYCTSEIRKGIVEMNSAHNDGYVRWATKQDLYLLKFMLDDVLANAPRFGEQEKVWVDEYKTQKAITKLGG
jgi:hypothetical protein